MAVITARKHSKRFPCKNFRQIDGKSLTELSVAQADAAKKEGLVQDVVLSTDSEYLLNQCKKYSIWDIGLRPENLAGDNIKSLDVLIDVLEKLKTMGKSYDAVLILQPTSPLRTLDDIRKALRLYSNNKGNSVITAWKIPNATINGLYCRGSNGFTPVSNDHNSGKRHQDLESVYLRNGAVFITDVYSLYKGMIISNNPLIYEMPQERSIDIDSEEDFIQAIKYRNQGKKFICIQREYSNQKEAELLVAEAIQNGQLPIVPDVLRNWLNMQLLSCENKEILKFCREHIYFDGTSIIQDGDVVLSMSNSVLSLSVICSEHLDEYVQEAVNNLCCQSDCMLLSCAK